MIFPTKYVDFRKIWLLLPIPVSRNAKIFRKMCIKLARGSFWKNSYRRIWRIVVPYRHAEFRAHPFRNEGSIYNFFSYFCMAPMETISRSHGSVRVVRTTSKVNGKC